MESIITKEVLDKVWEIGNQRVIELNALMEKYPILTRFIRDVKKDYITCLNAINSRDFNSVERLRKIIEIKERELEIQVQEVKDDEKRIKAAKKIKESEAAPDGK